MAMGWFDEFTLEMVIFIRKHNKKKLASKKRKEKQVLRELQTVKMVKLKRYNI